MADGFIVRKGGVAVERTTAPSINFISKTNDEIVVTFTNNDAVEAEIYYGLTAPLTDTVTLATTVTSSNITFSGLDAETQYTISAYALVTDPTSKKIKSEIVSTEITTDGINYTAATGGTTQEYNSGGKRYRSHTFLSNGDFVVSTVGDVAGDRNKVDYLIIAGGGAGGSSPFGSGCGAGGGAGGYRTTITPTPSNVTPDSKVTLTVTTFPVVIGAGAATTSATNSRGQNGFDSSALGITSTKGGGGGSSSNSFGVRGGSNGGSGGGAVVTGGVTGKGILGQGRDGGTANASNSNGGGGAGGLATQTGSDPGFGGVGLANTLRTGSNQIRARGGNGTSTSANTAVSGPANSGNGGQGIGNLNPTGGGGSGIVIIRYEIAPN